VVSLGLVAVFFGNQGFRSLVTNWIELRRLHREVLQLKDEQVNLSQELAKIHEGGAPFERLIRVDLGYIKKGEIEYRFPPPGRDTN
jgi:cell division protein FtsB